MRAAAVSVLFVLSACTPSPWVAPAPDLGLTWTPIDSLATAVPGATILAGRSEALPLRAWAVRLPANRAASMHVLLAADTTDGREGPSQFATRTGACVVLNGGYFSMTTGVPVGLARADGETVSDTPEAIERDGLRYPVARGAVGIGQDGVEVGWAGASEARCDAPPDNRPGRPAMPLTCRPWDVTDALGAGPMLLRDGQPTRSADAEAFFGTSIPRRHPRSALGVEADGDVWLVVVDGRQEASRGVNLGELAALMAGLGARDAVNLDGGGSSTLVVAGPDGPVRLNRPTGGTVEREVSTALGVFCDSP